MSNMKKCTAKTRSTPVPLIELGNLLQFEKDEEVDYGEGNGWMDFDDDVNIDAMVDLLKKIFPEINKKKIKKRFQYFITYKIDDVSNRRIFGVENISKSGLAKNKTVYEFCINRKTKPERKIIKKWINGKFKLLTSIAKVNFIHETAGSIRLSVIDTQGSSITIYVKKDSTARINMEPLLKNKKKVESIPKYLETFTYDHEPLIGTWFSDSDTHVSPLEEAEIGSRRSGYSGVTTVYTMHNPRILDS